MKLGSPENLVCEHAAASVHPHSHLIVRVGTPGQRGNSGEKGDRGDIGSQGYPGNVGQAGAPVRKPRIGRLVHYAFSP